MGTKRMLQPGRDFFTGEDEVALVRGWNDDLTSVKLGVCDDHAHHALRLQEQQIEQNEAWLQHISSMITTKLMTLINIQVGLFCNECITCAIFKSVRRCII